jgi:geranylgeranyl pyrophosphate synthase
VGGQAADIVAEGTAPSEGAVAFIHQRKTAMPLRAALRVGAVAAGASERARLALSAYGEKLGLAFQIADDLLDVRGTAEELGKAVRKDLARGKITYPGAVGTERAAARALALSEEAVSALRPFGADAWVLREVARFVVERRS